MANYTMTLAEMVNNPLTPIFPSSYPFYTDDEQIRKSFENKFISHYLTREIGFETPFQFKQMLYAKLVVNMDYWKKLYETEMKSKDINFLLNKDLVEEFTRELTGTQNTNDTSTTQTNQSENGISSSLTKNSSVNDGVASAKLQDGYLTNISSGDTTSTGSSSASGSARVTGNRDNQERETTRLVSQGNIGVTSTAELLQKWRECIINIDKLIIEECKDLFMQIY